MVNYRVKTSVFSTICVLLSLRNYFTGNEMIVSNVYNYPLLEIMNGRPPFCYMPDCQFIHCQLRYITVHDTYRFSEFLWKFHSAEMHPIITIKTQSDLLVLFIMFNQKKKKSQQYIPGC